MAQLKTTNVHGDLHVSGDITQEGNKVYHEGNKPSKADIELGNVTNVAQAAASTQIIAGTGLSGGGTLAANRTLSVNYGTTAGTAVQGNDSRVVNAVPNSRTISAGTGLSGGGTLASNRTLSVNYGTAAGTAAQGNDSRITGAMQKSANLSDVANAATARTNLGLSTSATRWPAWSEVTSKPSSFTPSSHTHAWTEVTDIPVAATRWPTWSEVTSKPSTFTPSSHTHPASEVTGLGTAASKNVGTSSGNVMEVGAFGLGLQSVPNFSQNDKDSPRPSGFYGAGSAAVTPFATTVNILHLAGWDKYQAQIAVALASGSYPRMFLRNYDDGVWSSPVEVYHSGNDSTSGVVPKGGIIMWSGATSEIPSGWALCNGANNTPDLRGRFIIGAGGDYGPGNTGNGTVPSHSHGAGTLAAASAGAHTHTGTAASAGAHTHATSSAGAHGHTGTASSAGAHTHTVPRYHQGDGNRTVVSFTSTNSTTTYPTSSAGAHTHSLSINSNGAHTHTANSAGAHTHTVSVTSAGAHTHSVSGSTAASGSGSEVIAKYYALCYIMKL